MSKGETFSSSTRSRTTQSTFSPAYEDAFYSPVYEGTDLVCPGRPGPAFSLRPGPPRKKKTASSAGNSAGLTGKQELFVAHCQGTAIRNNGDLADSGAFR